MGSDRPPCRNPSQCGPEATPDPPTRANDANDLRNPGEEAEPREEKGGHRLHNDQQRWD